MKVMIIKVSGKKAVAIKENGEFINMPAKKGMQAGVAFEINQQTRQPKLNNTFLSVAAAFFVLIMGVLSYSIFSVASYIDININPGIRLAVNPLGSVVSVEGINEDGKNLIAEMNLPNYNSLESEVKQIIEATWENRSLEKSRDLLITISDNDQSRASSREKELLRISFDAIKDKNLPVQIATQKISMKAFKYLREEQAKLSDGQRRSVYESDRLYLPDDRLFIGKTETLGKDQLKITFSKDVQYNGGIKIGLSDADGNSYFAQLISAQGNVWTLQSRQLKENNLYLITIQGLPDSDELHTSLLYNAVLNANIGPAQSPSFPGNNEQKNNNNSAHSMRPSGDRDEPDDESGDENSEDDSSSDDSDEDDKPDKPDRDDGDTDDNVDESDTDDDSDDDTEDE